MKLNRLFILSAAFLMAVAFGVMVSHKSKARLRYSKTGEFFGAYVKVDVCYTPSQSEHLTRAMGAVWARFADIHKRMSVYDPGSDINKINQAYHAAVEIPADTYRLIQDSIAYHRLSGGVYDITLGPLIQLWKQAGKEGRLPSRDNIETARSRTGMSMVTLFDNHRVQLTEGAKVNIDSIGDGFAADEAARILRAYGFEDFLVDASGELLAGGMNCQGRKWRVGIKDPDNKSSLIDVVELSDTAVSTSGSYERYFLIDGTKYAHIIDPRGGYPAKGVLSATVIAPSAQFADFLSTALCILSPREGLLLVDSLGKGHAALVITDDDGKTRQRQPSREYRPYRTE
jgi:thiamine biosynthesis lipoprotein